jgi:hypothetical protein
MSDKCLICGDVLTLGQFVFDSDTWLESPAGIKEIDELCEEYAKDLLKFLWRL